MAKVVKIPLVMKNGEKATDMKSLKENYDYESIVGYFLDGKLEKWLVDRYYEDEAEAVTHLSKDDPMLAKKLCQIFGVEYKADAEVDPEEIARRNERLNRLKQLTDDEYILANVDSVAFDQEELADLYDQGLEKIILCEGEFRIPKSKQDLDYTVIAGALVSGLPEKEVPEEASHIRQDVTIDKDLEIEESQEKTYQNARIVISGKINCEGTLRFDDCEIICDRTKDAKKISSKSVITISEGYVQFKNCSITYIAPDTDNTWDRKYFISGEDSQLDFDHCELTNCRYLLNSMKDSTVDFVSCTGRELLSPMMDDSAEKLSLKGCRFVSGEEAILPEELSNYNNKALFTTNAETIIMQESHFEGMVYGVVSSGKDADITATGTKFVECSAIVCGSDNTVNITNCTFERCIHLFKSATLNIKKSEFYECFGKIEADDLECEGSNWKKGFAFFDVPRYSSGRGGANFKKCIFEDINWDTAIHELCNWNTSGYRFFHIEDYEVEALFGGIDSLIDVGNTGSMKECKFLNIDVSGLRFIVSCWNYMDLERCVFENCSSSKDILDRVVYTSYSGGLFDRGKKRQASYYITSCKGID